MSDPASGAPTTPRWGPTPGGTFPPPGPVVPGAALLGPTGRVAGASPLGSIVVTLGILLIGAGFLLAAAVLYELTAGLTVVNFRTIDLYDAGQTLCVAAGALLVGVGRPIDQAAIARALDPTRTSRRAVPSVAGLVVFSAGIVLIEAWAGIWAYLELAGYYQVSVHPWKWTTVAADVALGFGVALVGIGLLLQRLELGARLRGRAS